MRIPLYIFITLFSCCVNVIFLEAIVSISPNAGIFITFSHYAILSLTGILNLFRQRMIPLKEYIYLVIASFLYGTASNYSLNFAISVPLHIIFRSGSLIANMILGVFLLKHSYTIIKYISVLSITIGLIIVTMEPSTKTSSQSLPLSSNDTSQFDDFDNNLISPFRFMIGVSLLIFSLFASALTGVYQELLFRNFGKHPKEAQFYMHFLSLPGFIFLSSNIYNQIIIFNSPPSMTIVPNVITVPILWIYLILNLITQYFCISSVYVLLSECTSLTVTFVTTLRKFLSLVISIYYFGHEFTRQHWTGATLVFVGTILFMDINWTQLINFRHFGDRMESEVSRAKKE